MIGTRSRSRRGRRRRRGNDDYRDEGSAEESAAEWVEVLAVLPQLLELGHPLPHASSAHASRTASVVQITCNTGDILFRELGGAAASGCL